MTQLCIVGMACRYPDARTPVELWENALAQRQAFRRIPSERLRIDDYFSADRSTPDAIYSTDAAVIEGYEFDRVKYRVSTEAFASADPTHWLALDVAAEALADAGFKQGAGLPRETTGVIVGNTLTGEFSRAGLMRLRWPYVRRVLDARPAIQDSSQHQSWLAEIEKQYKAPFPAAGDESLAGGLSNTIAGRIANHFDLKGGGFTVDGACASSLLAVVQAASALAAGDLDVAVVGGVDLSIDPFELVGFAKCGALASEQMRVFDARANGFLPGEGCGFVVLMRAEDAMAAGCRPYAMLRGWALSSDGSGGLTRPAVDGQLLALRRAYHRAGYPAGSVGYFEAHGTGTLVGDNVELSTISEARRDAVGQAPVAVVSTVKPNIGHTKAAAGVAGLIKSVMALHTQILPPIAGWQRPSEALLKANGLKVLASAEPWPREIPLRAGVSAMGFGGMNAHVTIESPISNRRPRLSPHEQQLLSSPQDAELFVFSGDLQAQAELIAPIANRLSRSELADLSVELARNATDAAPRAAIVASTPQEFSERIAILLDLLARGVEERIDSESGVYLGRQKRRVTLLFPGQGVIPGRETGASARRFPRQHEAFERLSSTVRNAEQVQPALAAAAVAALRVLNDAGVEADAAIGHSLGELVALHWAGAFDEATLLELAKSRGKAMDALADAGGSMLAIAGPAERVQPLIAGSGVVIAAYNSQKQTVVSGTAEQLREIAARARQNGLAAAELNVTHAFHSPAMANAVPVLRTALSQITICPLNRQVISTVTGAELDRNASVSDLLSEQLTSPVRFLDAVNAAAPNTDLFIEAGLGDMLSGLMKHSSGRSVLHTAVGSPSLKPLLHSLAALFVCGRAARLKTLLQDRFTRPFSVNWQPKFFANPCESVSSPRTQETPEPVAPVAALAITNASTLELIRQLVARRADLPYACVTPESRLLADLHLNSLVVAEVIVQACKSLELPPPLAPLEFADATVGSVAQALDEWKETGSGRTVEEEIPSGIDHWVEAFTVELRPAPRTRQRGTTAHEGSWQILAPQGYRWTGELTRKFAGMPGRGTIVCIPPEPSSDVIPILLAAVGAQGRAIFVQHRGGASAFAKTLYLESKNLSVAVVDTPYEDSRVVEWVAAEASESAPFYEAIYDDAGDRFEPVLKLCRQHAGSGVDLNETDVMLVTGGGKGITAECAIALVRSHGVRLAIIGRSSPLADSELAANLARMRDTGVKVEYFAADVLNGAEMARAIADAQAALGPVTSILHGAGVNTPGLLTSLTADRFRATVAPKVAGFANALAAVDAARLKLCISFGSLIGRTGLHGEGDYATANEWLRMATERWAAANPQCRCLALEWSIWSGAGMGQRLGRVEALARAGISAISTDAGVRIFRRLLENPPSTVSATVMGRYGNPPTLRLEPGELPIFRFLSEPRVHYPHLELVCDTKLSAETDLYLNDHRFHGQYLFPAVMGLEAMAQAAVALAAPAEVSGFRNVRFARPIAIPAGEAATIRLAALQRRPNAVDIAVRTDRTAFQADHFTATCLFGEQFTRTKRSNAIARNGEGFSSNELYGATLFQSGRFQRIGKFLDLHAMTCTIELTQPQDEQWYSGYLSNVSLLGDAGARDAAIHAIQCCIPYVTILPVGVEHIEFIAPLKDARYAVAREQRREGQTFFYDLSILDSEERELESWTGLTLQITGPAKLPSPLPVALLAPYVERRTLELTGVSLHVDVSRELTRAGDSSAVLHRRPDGKPDNTTGESISFAHSAGLKLTVRSAGSAGCDLELVRARGGELWREVLGARHFALAEQLVAESTESLDHCATRVWTARESLKKSGALENSPLTLGAISDDSWIVLNSGTATVATLIVSLPGVAEKIALAVLALPARTELGEEVAAGGRL